MICLLAHRPFFHDDLKNFVDVGGGILGCRVSHLDLDLLLELLPSDERARYDGQKSLFTINALPWRWSSQIRLGSLIRTSPIRSKSLLGW
ncbi:hypothetical protein Tco_1110536 [Tanacetum coccineum]|uniref:Uncharacterized protein n=1 Tax=Tanacetum coccineum TaxID=301880 RepID=A0ABQ5IL65_9ASTR